MMETQKVRAKVIMLPTDKESRIIKINSGLTLYDYPNEQIAQRGYTCQYLYFTTDEEIKEGDKVLFPQTKDNIDTLNCIGEVTTVKNKFELELKGNSFIINVPKSYCKKIVATTDKSLHLPQPSQAFIEKYCEVGGIDEVDIEYIEYRAMLGVDIDNNTKINYSEPWYEIKVDSTSNTITIHPIKDSWNRQEVEKLIELAWATASAYGDKTDSADCKDWINKNL